MLFCYLDDSGKDPQCRITNLGGYVAREHKWLAFETAVEPWFSEFGVDILHAKEMHDTDGIFSGWSKLRKHAFVSRVYQEMRGRISLGIASGVAKGPYEAGVAGRTAHGLRTVRPYTFCFNVLIDMLLTDIKIGKLAHDEGIAIFIEAGHENNPEAEAQFHDIRERHALQNVLRSISFIEKNNCRAIQVADLLSFYSRRHGEVLESLPPNERDSVELDTVIKIMIENLYHRTWIYNDFGESAKGARFFSEMRN